MTMKSYRVPVFIVFVFIFNQLYGQQVDIGIYPSSTASQMEIRIRPTYAENGTRFITDARFTVKWPVSSGISAITSGSPVSPYNFTPQGIPLSDGGYYYQKYATTGGPQVSWSSGAQIVVQTFTFTGPPCPSFEIADDAFVQGDVVNGDYYFEIDAAVRTGIIYSSSAQQPSPGAAGTITGISSVCRSQSGVSYSIAAVSNASGYAWTYTGSGATIYGMGTAVTVNFDASATSGILSVHGVNGCGNGTESPGFAITVNQVSVGGTASATNSAICQGNSTTLHLTGYTGTIQWQQSATGSGGWASVTGGSGGTTAAFTTPNLTVTTYYRAQVTSGVCTLAFSNVVTVTVRTLPVVYAGADKSISSGTATTINDASAFGTAPLIYLWTPAGSFINNVLLHPTTVNLTSSGVYTLTVTDGNNCSNSDQMIIAISGGTLAVNPSATPLQVCTGGSTELAANASGGAGPYTYSWTSSPAGFTSSVANPTVIPSAATTYTVQVSDGFDFVQGGVSVGFNTLPSAPVSGGNRTVCANQTYPSLSVTTGTDETADWYTASSGGSQVAVGITDYVPSAAGTYYAETRNTATGCVSATRTGVTLTVHTIATVYAGADRSVPSGTSVTISDATASGTTPLTYSWTPSGSFANAAILNPSTVNLTFTGNYTLTVINGNNCSSSDQMTIAISGGTLAVNPTATPSLVCPGGATQLNANASMGSGTYTYIWTSSPAGFSSFTANPVVNPLVTTTYTVQVSDGFNTVTGSVTVNINSLPAAPVSGGNKSVCAGQPVPSLTVTTASGVTADWYAGSSGGTALATGTLNYTPAGGGTFYAESRSASTGCVSASRTGVTLTVDALPVISAGADKTIPTGTSTTISDATASGAVPMTYAWTPAASVVNPFVLNPATVTLTLTDIYTLKVTDSKGCSSSDQMTIAISGGPLGSNPKAVPSAVCAGSSVQLYANASGGSGTYSYAWTSSPAGFTSASPNPVVIPGMTTTYSASINDGSTSVTGYIVVTVNPVTGPPASTGDKSICGNEPFPALAVVTGTGITADWYPVPSGGTVVASGITIFQPPYAGTWYAGARITATGCVSATRTPIVLTVNANPAAPVSGGDKAICPNQPFPVLTVSTSTGETADWYITSAGGTPMAPGTLSYTPSSAGTWYVEARNTTTGCVSTTRTRVTFIQYSLPPAPVSGGNRTICANQAIPALTVTTGTGITADWYSSTSGGIPLATGMLSFTPAGAGTFYAEARIAASGCVSTSRTGVTLTVNPNPAPPVSGGNRTICANQSVPALTVTTAGGVTANWYANASGGTALATGTLSYTPVSAGTFYAEARNSSTGCLSASRTGVTITVNPIPAAPVSGGNRTICANQPVPALSVSAGTGETADWYPFSSGGAALATGTLTYTPSGAGTFFAEARNTTSGCVSSSRTPVTLIVNLNPAAPASGGNKTICANQAVPPLTVTTGTGVTADWYAAASGGAPLSSGTLSFSPASTGTYYAEARNTTSGCVSTSRTAVTLTVNTLPVVYAGADKTIPNGANTTISDATASGTAPLTYAWTPAGSFVNASLKNPTTVNLSASGNFTFTVTNGNNCSNSDQMTITVTGGPLAINPTATPSQICAGITSQLKANASGGSGTYTYSWTSSPAGFTSSQANPSVTPAVSTVYTVLVNDGYNSVNANVSVTVSPLPSAPVSGGNKTICAGMPVSPLTVTTGTGVTADWYPASVGGTALATGTVSYTPPGAGTYYAEARNLTFGCVSATRTPVSLAVNANPPGPVSEGNKTICENQAKPALKVTTGTGITADWYAASSGGTPLATNTLSYYTSFAGTFYAEARNTASGCVSTSRTGVTLTVNINPAPPVSGGDKTICENQPVPVLTVTTGTGVTADWYAASTGGSPLASATLSFTPPGAGIYYAEARNTATGCLSAFRTGVTLSVISKPAAPVSDGNKTVCANQVKPALTVTTAAGITADWYTVSSGGTAVAAGTLSYTPASAGTWYAEARKTISGCISATRTPVTLSVVQNPAAPVSGGNKTICANQVNPAMTVTTAAGNTADWYTVSSGGTAVATGTLSYTPASAGTWYAEARNTISGCLSTTRTPVSLTVNTLPLVYAGADRTIPNGTNTTISDATASGTAPLVYSWTPSGSFVNAAILHPTTVNLSASANCTLTVTNGNNCSNTDLMTVTVTGGALAVNPTATPSQICTGGSAQLYVNASGGSGSYTYNWTSSPSGFTSVAANPVVSPALTTIYTVRVNDGYNTISGNITVGVNAMPAAPVSGGNRSVCANQSAPLLTVTTGAGVTADWYGVPSGGTALATGTLNFTPPGAGTYYAEAKNITLGCVSSLRTPVTLTVNMNPAAPVSGGDKTICGNQPVPAMTVTTATGETADWYATPSGGAPLVTGTLSYTPTGAGTWYAEARNTSSGCVSVVRSRVILTVIANPEVPVSMGNKTICADQPVPALTVTTGTGETADWYAASSGGLALASGVLSYTPPGAGTWYAEARNAISGCVSAARTQVTLTVVATPAAPVSEGSKITCTSQPVPYLTVTTGIGETADWYAASSGGPALASGVLGYTPQGAGTYYAEARNVTYGCVSATRTPVTLAIIPNPAAPVSEGNKTICANEPLPVLMVTTGTGETADWYSAYTGGTQMAADTLNFTPSVAGVYFAESRNTAFGCVSASRTPVVLTVIQNPPPPVSGENRIICAGQAVPALTVTTRTGETADWYPESSGGTPLATGTLAYTPPGAGTYYAEARNTSYGCTSYTRTGITLAVLMIPAAPVSGGNRIICPGQPLPALTVTTGTGETADWYAASLGGTPLATGTHSFSPPGAGTWYAEARNTTYGCTSNSRTGVTLAVSMIPAAPVSGGNRIICTDQPPPALTVTTGTGETADWYAASLGGTPLATGTLSYSPPGAGTWYAEARNTSSGCVSATRTPVILTLSTNPAAPVSEGNKTICANQQVPALVVTAGTGVTADWYSLSSGGIPLATGTLNFTPPGAGAYYAEARNNQSGCVSATRTLVSLMVIQNPPAPVSSGDRTFCANQPVSALMVTTGTGETADWYVTPSGGTPLATGSLNYLPQSAGTYYAETRNMSYGCVSATRTGVKLTLIPLPLVYAGADRSIPNGTSVIIADATVSGTEPFSFSWSPAASFLNSAVLNPVTVNLSSAGIYSLTVTDANNCTNIDQMTIYISGSPFAVNPAASPQVITAGQTTQLIANAAGGSGSYTYSWISNPAGFTSTAANPFVTPAVSTTYTVRVNDGYNVSTGFVVVTVNPFTPTPVSGGDKTVCANQPVPALTVTTGTGVTADWYASPTGGTPLAAGTLSFIPPTGGTYYAEARNTFTGSVSATRTGVTLTITGNPSVGAGADLTLCFGENLQISGATANNVSTWTWNTNGKGILTGSNSLSPVYQPAADEYGVIRFILSGSGLGSCATTTVSDTIMVTYRKPLSLTTSPDTTVLSGTAAVVSVKVTEGSGNYTYHWDPISMVTNYSSARAETSPLLASTQFLITVNDAGTGCSAEDAVRVTVEESIDNMLLISNGITPNGDGNNDVWKIGGIENFPDNEVIIFNRWGDKMRQLKNYDNVNVFWDGTDIHGKLAPDGTYFYVLTVRDIKTYKGWIQLKSSL